MLFFSACKHSPALPSRVMNQCASSLDALAFLVPALLRVRVFLRCDAADLRGAGVQYGQLRLCVVPPLLRTLPPELLDAAAAAAAAAAGVWPHYK